MTDFHPFFVHFPIALFIMAGILEIIMWLFPKLPQQNTMLMFLAASFFSIPAALTGDMAEYDAGKIVGIKHTLENHELAGNFITFSGIGFSFFLIFMKLKFPEKSLNVLRRLIFLLMAGVVLYAGFLGGTLVQEYGAGTKRGIEKIN